MTPQIQTLLTEAASLEAEVASFVDLGKLATFVKGIAAHLLSELPAAEQSEIHKVASEVGSVAPIVEALTPSGPLRTAEADLAAGAAAVAAETSG